MKGINLLEISKAESKDTRALKRRVTVYSVTMLVAFACLNLTLFFLTGSQNKKISNLNLEIKAQENLVTGLKDKEIKYQVLKDKISYLAVIYKDKVDIAAIIRFFQELNSQEMGINDLNVNSERISLSAYAKNSDNLTSIFFAFTNGSGKRLFKEVTLDNLSLDNNGGYSFTISVIPNPYEKP